MTNSGPKPLFSIDPDDDSEDAQWLRSLLEAEARYGVNVGRIRGPESVLSDQYIVFQDNRTIDAFDARLRYYLNRFKTWPRYDGSVDSRPNEITFEDRYIANQLAARRGEDLWRPLVGTSIAAIQPHWNLFLMSDPEWRQSREILKELLQPLLLRPGIRVASLTKALHRKRPNLIPICDSILLEIFGNQIDTKDAECALTLMDDLRIVGAQNFETLKKLAESANLAGISLSELRILDALCWTQWGPFPFTGTAPSWQALRSLQ